MDTSQGSIWNRWDLHIHTPASFHWNGGKKFADMTKDEIDSSLTDILQKMESLNVVAFGIMDYWTFDGYKALRNFNEAHNITNKSIFPGMELRIEAPVDYRLNIHILLSNDLSDDQLGIFKSHLEIRTAKRKIPLSDSGLIEFAKTLDDSKAKIHGFPSVEQLGQEELLRLGSSTAEITRESLDNAMKKIPKDSGVIILPYDTSDGFKKLDWTKNPVSDNYFMQTAHFFETRDREMVDLFLGKATPKNEKFISNFQKTMGRSKKPVLSGSDAHKVEDYGVFPNDRVTWIKANTTFKGIMQVFYQPDRSFVGEFPDQLKRVQTNQTKYIKSIEIRKKADGQSEEIWFDNIIKFNPGLVTIIGNKGNGKSALTDIIALMGESHRTDLNFLNKFRKSRDKKANNFESEMTWVDGSVSKKDLSYISPDYQSELVKYIPQNFFEKICNETPDEISGAFEEELYSAIFSHIPQHKRSGKDSLGDLIQFRTEQIKSNIDLIRSNVKTVNERIVNLEKELSEQNRKMLQGKIDELEKALTAARNSFPLKVNKPSGNSKKAQRIEKIRNDIFELEKQFSNTQDDLSALNNQRDINENLVQAVKGFSSQYFVFLENHKNEFDALKIKPEDVIKLITDDSLLASKRLSIDSSIEICFAKVNINDPNSLMFAKNERELELSQLTSELDNAEDKYQKYVQEIEDIQKRINELTGDQQTPGTLTYFSNKLTHLDTEISKKLAEEKKRRALFTREIFCEIIQLRTIYVELYQPVQDFIENHKVVKDKYQLNFNVVIQENGFVEKFLQNINQAVKSPYFGASEGRQHLQILLNEHDFSEETSIFRFIGKILSEITSANKKNTTAESISSIAKGGATAKSVYDILYSLDYLEPKYFLTLGGKNLSQLSPGERGVLLLIFYLLIDIDSCPLIIDQPEENLDSQSVYELLVECVREAKNKRQIIVVTHNPNLAVVCDADQIIYAQMDKVNGNKVSYKTGAIEEMFINQKIVEVLEGTWPAFSMRNSVYFDQQFQETI